MARYGDFYENKVTGERGVVLRGDEDSGGQPALVHLVAQPHGAVIGEHIHPRIREGFRVISGRLGTRVDGVERTLTAGEEAMAVPGTGTTSGTPVRRKPTCWSSSGRWIPGSSS